MTAKPRIAFQGERGAFSEEAAVRLLGEEIELVPRPTFESLFAAVPEGAADRILAPVENTLAGSVHRSYDLLLQSDLEIEAEVVHRISLCLIGPSGARRSDVQVVESHPVALAQCERFFAGNPQIRRVVGEDTAGSVRRVVEAGDITRAGIASRRAASVYGGTILQERMEDDPANFTRFLLLAPGSGERSPLLKQAGVAANKLSLVLWLPHRPGSLHAALASLAAREINLLRIEGRPIPGRPWEYMFYLDLARSHDDAQMLTALDDLRREVNEIRILGSYAAAEMPSLE
jgi:prephenate dehydratase